MGSISIETERLIIRDHVPSDLQYHHQLMSNPEIMYYIQDIQTNSLEASKKNLKFAITESKVLPRKYYFFAITLKDHTYVGSIGFTVIEENTLGGNVELGYFILKDYWGKGYTFEAAKGVIAFAFKQGFHKITTGCISENQGSENIMRKLKMTKESHLRQHVFHDNQWKDRVTYGLLRTDEWM
ncbi:MAG: GNAT family N-acetyltransferase [Clostridia bacterium]|nr:GNAT family N-acetyltransferase [Clostridia bacterium]